MNPKDYADGHALHRGLGRYFDYYNNERKHSELDNATPGEVFGCGAEVRCKLERRCCYCVEA